MDAADRTMTYLALQALAGRWASHGDRSPEQQGAFADLTPSELRVFSQNGEDGVIEEVFRHIGSGHRRFIEFGAEDGTEGNCAFLAEVLGWSGLFIEADPVQHAVLASRYRDRPHVITRHATVTPANINRLIEEAGCAGDVDVLSIDIDGHDYWVWEAISVTRPRLVIAEYNAHVPYPIALAQPLSEPGPWQGTDYFGASLGALEQLATARGYRLVHTDLAGVNAFFVPIDLATSLPMDDAIPRRSPNFFFTGRGHPPDASGRAMVRPPRL